MTEGFQRRRKGGAVTTFSPFEADLLRSLAGQLVELLTDEAAAPVGDPLEAMLDFNGPVEEPEDPVLKRLLPSAYREDQEAAGEFRRYTESDLRTGKAGRAAQVMDALEGAGLPPELDGTDFTLDIELDATAAMEWVKCLTDMRLALATRLGIADEEGELQAESLADDDPRVHVHDIYDWLGFLQETLVRALSR